MSRRSAQQFLGRTDLGLHVFQDHPGAGHGVILRFAQEGLQPQPHCRHRIAVMVAQGEGNHVHAVVSPVKGHAVVDGFLVVVIAGLTVFHRVFFAEKRIPFVLFQLLGEEIAAAIVSNASAITDVSKPAVTDIWCCPLQLKPKIAVR